MPNRLVIVHPRLNKVDESELFAGCRTAVEKLTVGLQQLTHRSVRAVFHPRSVFVAWILELLSERTNVNLIRISPHMTVHNHDMATDESMHYAQVLSVPRA
jgi:hypothetical protein